MLPTQSGGRHISSGTWLLFHATLFPPVYHHPLLCGFCLSVFEPLIWTAVFPLISPFSLSLLLCVSVCSDDSKQIFKTDWLRFIVDSSGCRGVLDQSPAEPMFCKGLFLAEGTVLLCPYRVPGQLVLWIPFIRASIPFMRALL